MICIVCSMCSVCSVSSVSSVCSKGASKYDSVNSVWHFLTAHSSPICGSEYRGW